MNDLDAFMDSISGDGLYNTARAQQLGYTKDESGHLPSVDHKTGDWLKSKKHPTAFMELYEYATNPHIQKKLNHPVVNIDGHFGKDQLTYPKRYADGGPVDPQKTPEYKDHWIFGRYRNPSLDTGTENNIEYLPVAGIVTGANDLLDSYAALADAPSIKNTVKAGLETLGYLGPKLIVKTAAPGMKYMTRTSKYPLGLVGDVLSDDRVMNRSAKRTPEQEKAISRSLQSAGPKYGTGGPIKPPKNGTTPEGFSLPGEEPNKADSLFLLNNRRILNHWASKKGYNLTIDGTGDLKGYAEFLTDNIEKKVREEILAVKDKGVQKTNPAKSKYLSDYIDRKGQMIGTQDWIAGGGEDFFIEKSYVHPKIDIQGQGHAETGYGTWSYHRVDIPYYDPLAITPWDMLSETQKRERVKKYGTSGTPMSNAQPMRPSYSSNPIKQPSIEQVQLKDEQLQPIAVPPAIEYPKAINTYSAAGYPMVGGKVVPEGRVHEKGTWKEFSTGGRVSLDGYMDSLLKK